MKKEIVAKLNISFGGAAYQTDDIEYWFARDLQVLLNYTEWRNFLQVVEKAKTACENSDQHISDHFVDVNKTINMPKGATKQIDDILLTRYAGYLIAQNGDPRKEQIAFAQSYFAIQTRKQELLEERIEVIERLQAREKLTTTEKEFSKLI
ncbi:MAG: BRO family protein, partial [Euryarchaeota archaeon]|nr:BRO family protein [Euryarchaeota archaeon]